TGAIQNALNAASLAGTSTVWIPAGTYLVTGTIRIPSNVRVLGAGRDRTVIKMSASIGRRTCVMQTGAADDPRENIVLEDLTIDANADRWSVSGGTAISAPAGVCLAIVNTQKM